MARQWTCRKCKWKQPRTASRTCVMCGEQTKPKARVPEHARTLRDETYATFEALNREIHGAEPDACGVCGKPPKEGRRHDRDHGHNRGEASYGKPRGLACGGNQGCNALMPSWLTAERARLVADYLARVEAHYSRDALRGEVRV